MKLDVTSFRKLQQAFDLVKYYWTEENKKKSIHQQIAKDNLNYIITELTTGETK